MGQKKLRILFDAHPLLGSKTGVGYYTDHLIRNLAEQYSDEVELVGYYHNFLFRKHFEGLPLASNIRYRRIAFMPGQIVNALRRLHIALPIELLTFVKADFILYPNFWGPPSLFRTPSAPVIHDLTYKDVPEYVSDKNAQDLNRFVATAVERASFVLTVSEFSKSRIIDDYHVEADDIVVIPIPPATPQTQSANRTKLLLEARNLRKPFILFVSTLEPRKNVTGLIEAYALLPEHIRKQYSLVLAGKIDWKFEAITDRIKELQDAGADIVYLGYVSDEVRVALYRSASLFVLPSFYEGFGMPILEAFSYGLPVVVSDIPVFHEVAGEAADYCNPSRAGLIADGITDALEHKKSGTAIANRLKHFPSWDELATKVMSRIKESL